MIFCTKRQTTSKQAGKGKERRGRKRDSGWDRGERGRTIDQPFPSYKKAGRVRKLRGFNKGTVKRGSIGVGWTK